MTRLRKWLPRPGSVKIKRATAALLLVGAVVLPAFNTAAASPRAVKFTYTYNGPRWPAPGVPKPGLPRSHALPPHAIKVPHSYPHDPRYGPH